MFFRQAPARKPGGRGKFRTPELCRRTCARFAPRSPSARDRRVRSKEKCRRASCQARLRRRVRRGTPPPSPGCGGKNAKKFFFLPKQISSPRAFSFHVFLAPL